MTIYEAKLWSAYVATRYVVFADDAGEIVLRIGECAPELDALLERAGASSWCFVTAANPDSRPLDEATNDARNAELQRWLADRQLVSFPGEGRGDDGAWPPEPSFLVLGLERRDGVALGRRFGQRAIVVGALGGRAELVDCRTAAGELD